MNETDIKEIWKRFRESDKKSDDGSMEKATFMNEMNVVFNHNLTWDASTANELFSLIFGRFDYKRNNTVEIYDFLVSMAVCASIGYEEKLQRRPV